MYINEVKAVEDTTDKTYACQWTGDNLNILLEFGKMIHCEVLEIAKERIVVIDEESFLADVVKKGQYLLAIPENETTWFVTVVDEDKFPMQYEVVTPNVFGE